MSRFKLLNLIPTPICSPIHKNVWLKEMIGVWQTHFQFIQNCGCINSVKQERKFGREIGPVSWSSNEPGPHHHFGVLGRKMYSLWFPDWKSSKANLLYFYLPYSRYPHWMKWRECLHLSFTETTLTWLTDGREWERGWYMCVVTWHGSPGFGGVS